jgi:hypothetical protein
MKLNGEQGRRMSLVLRQQKSFLWRGNLPLLFPLPSRVFGPETRVTNVLDTWVTLFGGYQRSNPTEIVRYKRFVKAVFH